MPKNLKPTKSIKAINLFLFILISILLFYTTNKNSANETNDFCSEKLNYTFKVSDKLIGAGLIDLTLEKDKIKGIATGLGMSCQCNVDFNTNIEGSIDKHTGDVYITVSGIGKPIGILLPGKITFNGPLKGYIKNKNLTFRGKVNIKGALASLGGFKKKENILIEIEGEALANIFKKQSKDKLALTIK